MKIMKTSVSPDTIYKNSNTEVSKIIFLINLRFKKKKYIIKKINYIQRPNDKYSYIKIDL